MELYPLKVFLTVATERSFSRAGEKLLRTQPAISIAIQRLEGDLKEKLIDRSGRELLLTDAGRVVLEYARRFQNLESDLENALRELKDNYAGRLSIGANESTSLYLIQHIEQYRRLFPKVKVQVRRTESSKIPSQLLDGELELGVISYDPGDDRVVSQVIYTDQIGTGGFAAAPVCKPGRSIDHGIGYGDVHRPQRPFAISRVRFARVSAPQSAVEHGCRNADRRDDPPAGSGQRRRRISSANVRRAGDPAGSAARNSGKRDYR